MVGSTPVRTPPSSFIAAPVDLAMVTAAEWNREFIADLTAECPALRKAEMVGICRLPAADRDRDAGRQI